MTARRVGRRGRGRNQPGTPPGTIAIDPQARPPAITVMAFGPDGLVERTCSDIGEAAALRATHAVTWVDVDGLGDEQVLSALQQAFGLHPLALEDVVGRHQRPKLEVYGDHIFLPLRMFRAGDGLEDEQLSLFLGPGYVLSLQERYGDCLDPVRENLREGRGCLREHGADFLAYTLLDAVVDQVFPLLEGYDERIERLEDQVFSATGTRPLQDLQRTRHELALLRRAIWPLRELAARLQREDTPLVTAPTRTYLRDTYDHVIQQLDLIEGQRELVGSLLETLLTILSNRLNQTMKVLTIIGTIFIPLGVVAGVYGMNFDTEASPWNMPELGWAFGYPFVLALMASVAGGLLLYFWRRGWLGRG
jgi:magnesium transporter